MTPAGPLRAIGGILETAVVALLFAALILGVSVGLMTAPGVVSYLERANHTWVLAGMSQQATLGLAEQTRRYVVADIYGENSDIPPTSLRAYDTAELSHLTDVRSVMSGARTATGVSAALLALWLVFGLVSRRWAALRRGTMWGGIVPVVLVLLLAIASTADFSAVFGAFHELFFKAGTWQFPPDSLLIRVFPAGFWMAAAASWGGLIALGGAALVVASLTLPRDDAEAQRVSQTYHERRLAREARAVSKGR